MSVSVFEIGGRPVDGNTASAISGGTNYEPAYKNTDHIGFFKVRPFIPDIPRHAIQIHEQAKKFIGERRSRLVIVAWFGAGGKWLCRCDCGYYVVRKLTFLKNKDKFDACPECRFVIQKRRHHHWLTTGKDVPEEYFS
jgi:hypothetical protein